ncbi:MULTISPECIES: hypothetical protein [unclassified Carboxylicivirga]|uniref:hypothetical protein n=1 Tax=Carboxylicivirga TaxID=1628153 RepID=UPI003D332A50
MIALIDVEIRGRKTGSPNVLAGRLCMSVRMLFFYIDTMKALGASIRFSKENNTFEYEQSGYFKDGIQWVLCKAETGTE